MSNEMKSRFDRVAEIYKTVKESVEAGEIANIDELSMAHMRGQLAGIQMILEILVFGKTKTIDIVDLGDRKTSH